MMKAFLLLPILYPLIICIDDYYIGAVVEYAPIDIEDIEVPLEVNFYNYSIFKFKLPYLNPCLQVMLLGHIGHASIF